MNQISNPFDSINPFNSLNSLNSLNRFKGLISHIKNKQDLLNILRLIEARLNEFN